MANLDISFHSIFAPLISSPARKTKYRNPISPTNSMPSLFPITPRPKGPMTIPANMRSGTATTLIL